jgi:hypothetical protein
LHRKFQKLLHDYKLEVFHSTHDKRSVEEITTECLAVTQEVMNQKLHYHFHKLADANRAEIINMINNYVREAILPPVIERMLQRQVRLEKRVDALEHLLEHALETLSEPAAGEAVG